MITAAPNAIPGVVSTLTLSPSLFTPPCAVLCRNTAPLIPLAYYLFRHSIPCAIAGRDLGTSLITLIKKFHAPDIPTLLARLEVWQDKEIAKRNASNRSVESVNDQAEAIRFFASAESSVDSIITRITSLFQPSPSPSVIHLSTIHRAKGLEWPLVFILDWHLIPSRYATSPSALRQERNLQYVAITRSSNALHYITSPCKN